MRGANQLAALAGLVLALLEVAYLFYSNRPLPELGPGVVAPTGPGQAALMFLNLAIVVCLAAAISPWRKLRIVLLSAMAASCVVLGLSSFPVGLVLWIPATLAAAAVPREIPEWTTQDGMLAALGGGAGLGVVALVWLLAIQIAKSQAPRPPL